MGKAAKSAARIYHIMDEPSEIDPTEIADGETYAHKETFVGEIEFHNVWFRYPERKAVWVLKNFSLKLKPNESTALVGQSGCGKSTIIQLIYRFYDPQEGHITIDGVDIKKYNIASLRAMFGLVSQEPLLFDFSIAENIRYGVPDAPDFEIQNAAKNSNAV